jgi:hypothetical protein
MRYSLLLHYAELLEGSLDEAQLQAGMAAFAAYAAALEQAGALVGAEVLQPSSLTTTVTMHDGALQVQDGPFIDTKEQLAGIVVIDVPDLDAAIEWAGRAPPVEWGAVEIRPGATFTVAGRWVPNT